MYDLPALEDELKKQISSEAELQHASKMQPIINYAGFSLTEILKVCKGYVLAGPRGGFLPTHQSFDVTVLNVVQFSIDVSKKLKFVLCEDKRHTPSTTYILAFPAHKEEEYVQILKRVDRLKAFL